MSNRNENGVHVSVNVILLESGGQRREEVLLGKG